MINLENGNVIISGRVVICMSEHDVIVIDRAQLSRIFVRSGTHGGNDPDLCWAYLSAPQIAMAVTLKVEAAEAIFESIVREHVDIIWYVKNNQWARARTATV